MIDHHWYVRETDGPSLVAAVVENDAPTPRRIVVEPRIEGAGDVHPPRRRGLPERGWRDGEFSGVVAASDRLAVGFAATGPLEDPPVAVIDEGRPPGDDTSADSTDPSPTDVLRDLGSPLPPRDAVPDDPAGVGWSSPDGDELVAQSDRSVAAPGSVADWLDDVAGRVEQVERLVANGDLDGAGAAVDASGGLPAVEDLVADLARDEAMLRSVTARAAALADDCEQRADVPLSAYRRLS